MITEKHFFLEWWKNAQSDWIILLCPFTVLKAATDLKDQSSFKGIVGDLNARSVKWPVGETMVLLWGLFLVAPKTVRMNFVHSPGLKDAKTDQWVNWQHDSSSKQVWLPVGKASEAQRLQHQTRGVSRPKCKVTFRKGMFGFVWNLSDWPRIMCKGREDVLTPALDFSDASLRSDDHNFFSTSFSKHIWWHGKTPIYESQFERLWNLLPGVMRSYLFLK